MTSNFQGQYPTNHCYQRSTPGLAQIPRYRYTWQFNHAKQGTNLCYCDL